MAHGCRGGRFSVETSLASRAIQGLPGGKWCQGILASAKVFRLGEKAGLRRSFPPEKRRLPTSPTAAYGLPDGRRCKESVLRKASGPTAHVVGAGSQSEGSIHSVAQVAELTGKPKGCNPYAKNSDRWQSRGAFNRNRRSMRGFLSAGSRPKIPENLRLPKLAHFH